MNFNRKQLGIFEEVGAGMVRGASRRLALLGSVLGVVVALTLVVKYFVYFMGLLGVALVGFIARQVWRAYKLRRGLKDLDGELPTGP